MSRDSAGRVNRDMSNESKIRGVAVGAGYFSHYQYESWARIPEVAIVALANRTVAKAEAIGKQYGIGRVYADWRKMIDAEKPDFIDIITAPDTHAEICGYAAARGVHLICQKPLAHSFEESAGIVRTAEAAGVRFMVHENWRWQPWYREIRNLLDEGRLGEAYHLHFRMRTGDGWGENAYLARQPFFRDYPRLLLHETGVHFIDAFRFLLGEVRSVHASLRRLNPVIRGEDSGQVLLRFESGTTALLDANRYNETEAKNPRLTFGELWLDASRGHLTMDGDGAMRIKRLGEPSHPHRYLFEDRGFAGDCCHRLQRHFVEQFLSGGPFESHGRDYLRTLRVVEACYRSAAENQVVKVEY